MFKMCIIGLTLYGKEESDRLDKLEQDPQSGGQKKEGEVVELTKFIFKDRNLDNMLFNKEGNQNIGLVIKSSDGKASYQINT